MVAASEKSHAVIGVNHLGIAVRSIAMERNYYETVLCAEFEGVEDVPEQKVRVAFFRIGGPHGLRLELLEPTSDDSPVAAFLEKRGPGIHHVALAVENIAASLDAMRAAEVRLIDEAPRLGAHAAQIAFLNPKSTGGVLTELCQTAESHEPNEVSI